MTLSEGTPLAELYERRVENNQDLIVIVDDRHNRRGTGKTTLSLGLAATMDRTDDGLDPDHCSISPHDLMDAYISLPKGAGLVLDEAEAGASKYRAGSQTNMALRELVSMGRIKEKYVVMNLPSTAEMDAGLKALADVWIMVERKGLATVHFLGWNPYQEHPLTPTKQQLRWTDLSDPALRECYDYLADRKEAHLDGSADESKFIRPDDHRDEVEATREQAAQDTRDDMIRRLYDDGDLTQSEIAEIVDLSRSRVADILS